MDKVPDLKTWCQFAVFVRTAVRQSPRELCGPQLYP